MHMYLLLEFSFVGNISPIYPQIENTEGFSHSTQLSIIVKDGFLVSPYRVELSADFVIKWPSRCNIGG